MDSTPMIPGAKDGDNPIAVASRRRRLWPPRTPSLHVLSFPCGESCIKAQVRSITGMTY